MARQNGIIKLKGTIGDITFYRSKDGYIAREKGGVSGSRIMSDPAFQRTRENGAEFGRAGRAGKYLRQSIQSLIKAGSDSRMVSRLTREMLKVIQMDNVNPRGERNVIDGEAELLQGFEFNINAKLGTTLFAPYSVSIERSTGEAVVEIGSFVPSEGIGAPSGATHYKIVCAAMEIDFEAGTYVSESSESGVLPWDTTATSPLMLTNTLPAGSVHPLFVVLGINFYQEVNGTMYLLKNGAYNALQIVKVLGV